VRFPVFFLTGGGTRDSVVTDKRKTSVEEAIRFAKNNRLFGIVSNSQPILSDLSLVQKVHSNDLLLFTYGSNNNISENVQTQKDAGVDAIISDNIFKLRAKPRNKVIGDVENNNSSIT